MRIAYIATISKSISWFMLQNALYMSEKGHEVYIICHPDQDFIDEIEKYENIHYVPIRMKRGTDINILYRIFSFYIQLKKYKFDIIQYTTQNASLYSSIAGFFANIPNRVYRQWGIRYVGFSGFKRFIFYIVEKLICTFSTYITPDSFSNLEFSIKSKLYNRNKSDVILYGSANGVDLKKFDVKKKSKWNSETRQKLKLRSNEFVIGYVGRIVKDKGIQELITAFLKLVKKYDNLTLLLVGYIDNDHGLEKEVIDVIESHQRIIVTGYVECTEKYYSTMDLFILPSHREGFGNVVIEAQSMNVPVIASNINGPVDIIVNEVNGLLFEKGNYESLANAIIQLISNTKIRNDIANGGYESSVSKYDQNLYNQANLKMYSEFIEEKM